MSTNRFVSLPSDAGTESSAVFNDGDSEWLPGESEESESELIKHERFYFKDGNLVLLVDDTLFRIHEYFFERDSRVIASMIALPESEGKKREGKSDESPIELEDQDINELECFLSFLYPAFTERRDIQFWLSCLRFADKWDFEAQKAFILDKINEIGSPAEKVVAGRLAKWGPALFIQPFIDMFNSPLTREEGNLLDKDDLVLLCRIQHYARSLQNYSLTLEDYLGATFIDECNPGDLKGIRKLKKRNNGSESGKAMSSTQSTRSQSYQNV